VVIADHVLNAAKAAAKNYFAAEDTTFSKQFSVKWNRVQVDGFLLGYQCVGFTWGLTELLEEFFIQTGIRI
jgi:hypothetical protein